MPDVPDLPTSGDDAKDSAMFTGKVAWVGLLVLVGIGLLAAIAAALKRIPGVGSVVQEGQDFVRGKSSADNRNDSVFTV